MHVRPLVHVSVWLVASALFAGCATFSSPGLTTVMATTCSNEITFNGFRSCVNSAWYANVVAQGYGSDPLVLQFNSRMQLLAQGVAQRQISDIDAISNATSLAYQLRAIEESEISRQNDALRRVLEEAARYPSNSTPSRPTNSAPSTVYCTRIGDSSRQVYTFNSIACPVGYAPTL